MSSWDGLNRRKFPRIKYPCLVVVHKADDEKEVILSHTENIGIGGVCVILKQDIKIATPVQLEIDLLDLGDHIKCKGTVVWNVQRKADTVARPNFFDIGVEFLHLEEKYYKRLEEIIKRLVKNNKEVPFS